MPPVKQLVFGVVYDNLVLLPEDVARAYAADHQAILGFTTFSDARRYIPLGINPVPGLDAEYLEEEPEDDDPYDVKQTPEFQDGNWPPPAATIALESLPPDLRDIGELVEHFPNFPTLEIDPATEEEVVRTLRDRGSEVVRDQELIQQI